MTIALLGDSIFDNCHYVGESGLSVEQHLKSILRDEGRAAQVCLLASDGAVTTNIQGQLKELPRDARHIIVSVGGNDALQIADRLMEKPCKRVSEALDIAHKLINPFRCEYRDMLSALKNHRSKHVSVCTIYDAIPGLSAEEYQGITLFNDIIIRLAVEFRVDVIDLRQVCTKREHYSQWSPIEPSHEGGLAIAQAIVRATFGTRDSITIFK